MNSIVKNLFVFENPTSIGTKIYLRFFELFVVYNIVVYGWEWGLYVTKLGDVVVPLGIARYVNIEFMFHHQLSVINAALITVLGLIAFFSKKLKWLYGIVFILIHFQFAARYSQGEIPHSESLLGLSALGLGLGSVFIPDKQKSLQFALGFVWFFLGLGYTSAALSKLIATGPHWVNGAHLWLWISEKSTDVLSDTGHYHINFLQQLILDHWWLATAFLTFGLLTELSGFLLWWKKFRPFIFILIIGLHFGIYHVMKILWFYYTIELFIIGFPWHKVLNYFIDESTFNSKSRLYKFVLY